MFTFRAGEQKPLLSRDASAPDIERYSQPWDTTQTPTEEACSTKADDDDHDAGGPSAVGSHFHHHYHCHHHHYHVGTKHGARRRYPVPPDDPPQSLDTAALHLAPELDPLTWHSSNQSVSAGTQGNAWLAEILGAHGVGQEWGAEDVARRWSQRRNTLDSAVEEDEFSRYNPHWDDMITFRQTRVRVPRERAWSGSEASFASEAPLDRGWRLLPMATNSLGRLLCLTVLPVAFVLAWCAVPLRTDVVVVGGEPVERLNFWFFLFFYYGTYNAVALMLVTQIFHVYSLTWWPKSMSGVLANVISWLFSTCLGALVYLLDTGIEKDPLMWTSLTLLTLLLPVVISFVSIQRHHRKSASSRRQNRRQAATEEQPLMATSTEWRTPSSYRRFLWFCSSFLLWYAALAAGEYLAYVYIDTLPHTTKDGFYYVYSWIATVNILSGTASWVVNTKIRSWPLQYIYTLYFFMTYFIFYRNLFARLQNPEQVIFLQLGSSLWVVFIYPVRMAKWVYRIMAYFCGWGEDYPYETYVRQISRTFFLRNKAENATMLGFLCWLTILHFGPNSKHYPYFQFEPENDEFRYEYSLTLRASIYVWISELLSSLIVRSLFRWIHKQDTGEETVLDFRRYPHVVPVMVLVTIHVLQNILFGMIHLDFS
ncbi:hypothetical protein LPJ60_003221 [Coemansia sp. RSA 2675]|nr:hypothetical protein LPJ60_003221 [Coemansia sp. RSA 2675]KAJ2699477.1 hypothetical protein H4218_002627 [Coemansia sp. IMI 209128]